MHSPIERYAERVSFDHSDFAENRRFSGRKIRKVRVFAPGWQVTNAKMSCSHSLASVSFAFGAFHREPISLGNSNAQHASACLYPALPAAGSAPRAGKAGPADRPWRRGAEAPALRGEARRKRARYPEFASVSAAKLPGTWLTEANEVSKKFPSMPPPSFPISNQDYSAIEIKAVLQHFVCNTTFSMRRGSSTTVSGRTRTFTAAAAEPGATGLSIPRVYQFRHFS